MDRIVIVGGLAYSGGVVTILYGVLSSAQASLQIVGVGTILTSVLPFVSYLSTRQETKRKEMMEKVEKLYPNDYNPLSSWSKTNITFLGQHDSKEIWSESVSSPPPVELQGVFTLHGALMKAKIRSAEESFEEYQKFRLKTIYEYKSRLSDAVKEIKFDWGQPDWTPNMVVIEIRRNTEKISDGLLQVANDYPPLEALKERIKFSTVMLHYSGRNSEVDCPADLKEKITQTDNLPSFSDFLKARKNLQSELTSLKSELDHAIEHGERDW